MSFSEVSKLRKAGRLTEAYQLAQTDLEAMPDDVLAKRTMAWVLYDFAKKNATIATRDKFLHCLKQLNNFELDATETMLWTQVTWLVSGMVATCVHGKCNDTIFYDALFTQIEPLKFVRPDASYSALLRTFLRIKLLWSRFGDFCRWWNFDFLTDADYKPFITTDGQKVLSLAERAFMAYSKSLLQPDTTTADIEKWITKLDLIISQHPNYIYLPYFKAKLLIRIGQNELAIKALKPFLKLKTSDFWVWELLGDATADDKKQFAFYCKAMLCHAKDEMKIALREKMMDELIEHQHYSEAKAEWQKIIDTRTNNGWAIPQKIIDIEHENWFVSCKPTKQIDGFYKQYSTEADAFAGFELKTIDVLITHINTEKKVVSFVTSNEQLGFFKFKGKLNFGCHSVLTIETEDLADNGFAKVMRWQMRTDTENFEGVFFVHFAGVVHKSKSGFAIVDRVFVPATCLQSISNGTIIAGVAVKSYGRSKERWGWTAIDVQLQNG